MMPVVVDFVYRQDDGAIDLPQLAREFSRFYVGRLYARETLSQKQRELCAVAALAVLNYQEELAIHAGAASPFR